VPLPFVLIYVAVGFMMEALFGIRLRRGDDSDGTGIGDEVLTSHRRLLPIAAPPRTIR